MIRWLKKQGLLHLSQFTIDWMESIIDGYQMMEEADVLPPEIEVQEALKYNVKNVLAVIRPDLPDVAFFNSLLQGKLERRP